MVEHTKAGNCWHADVIYDCPKCGEDACDVCHKHDEPRGLCLECAPCVACERDGDGA